ncbi:MAG: DUF3105 domain-containing protein [Chloroflexota bacterium]|nr:DUF3105 domain-containing protein [Chloroflexota bacterium]
MAEEQERRRQGSRRAQAARQKRRQSGERRRNRTAFTIAAALLGIVALAAVVVFVAGGSGGGVGREVEQLVGVHSPPYVYNTNPPTSGNHLPSVGPYGHWGEDLVPELVVHNLEHGAVVIWYAPDDPELAGSVNRLVRSLGPTCIVAGSYPGMDYPVAATVWGRILELEQFDEAALRNFVEAYRGQQGPEAGVCFSEPVEGQFMS